MILDAYTQDDVFYSWRESKGQLAKTEGVELIATEGRNFILTDVTSMPEQIRNNSKGMNLLCQFILFILF